MPNRLAKETSPYLQQHADNPVDWYPWGEEAFTKAKEEDKPILLSIGYSSCHWCHVMEKESFEDPGTAKVMNENFVNIKVDREERPDLDTIYMEAVQAMTGQGGWPLTVFLTPNRRPFYGGTYFPPIDRGGLPSFNRVLKMVAETYRDRRRDTVRNAEAVQRAVGHKVSSLNNAALTSSPLENAFLQLTYVYDKAYGGFGGAPKFPQPSVLEFLIWLGTQGGMSYSMRMVEHTLDSMARGGVYDHLGGGFHRYSVDARWLVPHFEKMLYDNAQLSLVYLHAYQVTRKPFFKRVVEESLDYVVREMRHPAGGFFSTQDADSEGEEGRFYLWTRQEIEGVLGKNMGEVFCRYFGVSESGNLEGKSILNTQGGLAEAASSLGITVEEAEMMMNEGRSRLLAERDNRVKPGRDEKILCSWNGLMLKSFAEAARALKREDYGKVAEEGAKFILEHMYGDRRLKHSWRDGRVGDGGFLEDYAFLADGLLSLYQTTFDPRLFEEAISIADTMMELFQDEKEGIFYDTPRQYEALYARPKTLFDHSTPSPGSAATRVLLTLHAYTGEPKLIRAAEKALKSVSSILEQQPASLCSWLTALKMHLSPPVEVALAGDSRSENLQKMLSTIFDIYRPNMVVALQSQGHDYSGTIPLLRGKTMLQGQATAYVCKNFQCENPVTDPEALRSHLE